jgi:hypothetical protein
MDVGIRELEAHLSQYVDRPAGGRSSASLTGAWHARGSWRCRWPTRSTSEWQWLDHSQEVRRRAAGSPRQGADRPLDDRAADHRPGRLTRCSTSTSAPSSSVTSPRPTATPPSICCRPPMTGWRGAHRGAGTAQPRPSAGHPHVRVAPRPCALQEDWERTYVVALDERTCEIAAGLAEVTGARSLDALHLATAQRAGAPALRLVTFDVRMAQEARALGGTVVGA